jgi:hypothetical protein
MLRVCLSSASHASGAAASGSATCLQWVSEALLGDCIGPIVFTIAVEPDCSRYPQLEMYAWASSAKVSHAPASTAAS